MKIRQLTAFRATVLAGTVSGAAELLDLSQPKIWLSLFLTLISMFF